MYTTGDTIVAIATPPGRGGIGVVRLSGPEAGRIATTLADRKTPLEPRYATLALLRSAGTALDRVLLTFFPAPASYTGEDVAEISAHGSPVLLQAIVALAMQLGARLAEPGEFTLRAYLNDRIDLVQAEAVRDLIESATPLQARAAFDQLEGTLTRDIGEADTLLFDLCARLEASLDFPDEGYHFVSEQGAEREIAAVMARISTLLGSGRRGRVIRDGLQVVLTGRTNSGKSSIFNKLAGFDRAIVTTVAGTTRDLISERIELCGVLVTLVDTAGIRGAPADEVEAEGIARSAGARQVAAVLVIVLDGSSPLTEVDRTLLADTSGSPRVVVINKSDLAPAWSDSEAGREWLPVSALTEEGLDALRQAILSVGMEGPLRDPPAVTNVRHMDLLEQALAALTRARAASAAGVPEELVLTDLHEARARLEEVTGARTAEDTLEVIFSRFCIGK